MEVKNMTKENEFKLLKLIAQSHLGDSRFEKNGELKYPLKEKFLMKKLK